jgi:hypothetical protein
VFLVITPPIVAVTRLEFAKLWSKFVAPQFDISRYFTVFAFTRSAIAVRKASVMFAAESYTYNDSSTDNPPMFTALVMEATLSTRRLFNFVSDAGEENAVLPVKQLLPDIVTIFAIARDVSAVQELKQLFPDMVTNAGKEMDASFAHEFMQLFPVIAVNADIVTDVSAAHEFK